MPDTSQGKLTTLSPSLLQRASQAARYVITGVSPSNYETLINLQ